MQWRRVQQKTLSRRAGLPSQQSRRYVHSTMEYITYTVPWSTLCTQYRGVRYVHSTVEYIMYSTVEYAYIIHSDMGYMCTVPSCTSCTVPLSTLFTMPWSTLCTVPSSTFCTVPWSTLCTFLLYKNTQSSAYWTYCRRKKNNIYGKLL